MYLIRTNVVMLLIMCIASTPIPKIIAKKVADKAKLSPETRFILKVLACMTVFVLSVAYLTGDSYNPFLYFRF
jgi:alginate O-acetyltransferase complex protein AlgI